MLLNDAIQLIDCNELSEQPGMWTDLGCGDGLFTFALANLLLPGSTIYAIDKEPVKLLSRANPNHINVVGKSVDFVKEDILADNLSGILMANSLHFVEDKLALIEKLGKALRDNGYFVIVEYDTIKANSWVPYPIDFKRLTTLFDQAGYKFSRKLGERPSVYGNYNIYSAIFSKQEMNLH